MQAPRLATKPSKQHRLDVQKMMVPSKKDGPTEPAFLARRKARCGAPAAPAPRQMISDMKWEGAEWMTPQELARTSKCAPARKRKRGVEDEDDGEDGDEWGLGDRPSGLADEEWEWEGEGESEAGAGVDANTSAAAASSKTRKRDKDRIPSRFVTVQTGPDTWERVPRPRKFENGRFFAYRDIPQKQKDLLQLMLDDKLNPIDDAFLREHLVRRLNRTHPVSLRLVDWLVVDYACAEDVVYRRYIPSLKRDMIVVVHKAYTSWLDRWRRRHFDPFRRRLRILFELDGCTYSTTVAQLHFFYMANIYGFLEYASLNRKKILAHMTATTAASNAAKAAAKAEGRQAPRKPLVSRAKSRSYLSIGKFRLSFRMDGDGDRDQDGSESDPDLDLDQEESEGEGEAEARTDGDTDADEDCDQDAMTSALFPAGF